MIADRSVTRNEAIQTAQFFLLWGILFINVTAGIGILAQASPMMQDMFHRTPLQAAAVVSLISIFNASGRFLWASVSDYIGRRNTYTIFFVVQFVLFLLIPRLAASGNWGVFEASLFIVFTMYGGGFATIPAFLADIFGPDNVGAIHGALLTAWSAAAVAGPVIITELSNRAKAALPPGADRIHIYDTPLQVLAGTARGRLRPDAAGAAPPAQPAAGGRSRRGLVAGERRDSSDDPVEVLSWCPRSPSRNGTAYFAISTGDVSASFCPLRPADDLVDEPQLGDGRGREDERVGVGEPEAAIQVVQHVGQRKPAVDQPLERGRLRRHRLRRLRQRRLVAAPRPQRQAARGGGLERVDHVQIVRPRLGPVLPRMRARVGADEPLLPVGRGAVLVVRAERLGVVGALVAEQRPELVELRRVPRSGDPSSNGRSRGACGRAACDTARASPSAAARARHRRPRRC